MVCLQWKPIVNSFKWRCGLLRLPHSCKSLSGFHLEKSILIFGDVQSNPGPRNQVATKFPCKQCGKAVRNNQDAILCEDCDTCRHTENASACPKASLNIISINLWLLGLVIIVPCQNWAIPSSWMGRNWAFMAARNRTIHLFTQIMWVRVT